MAYLQIIEGVEPGRRLELSGNRSVIGRSSDCQVSLDVAAVSRQHAVLLCEQGVYYIEDMGSRNGTFVNNRRIDERTLLHPHDRILICDQVLTLNQVDVSPIADDEPSLAGFAPKDESSLGALVRDDVGDEMGPASVVATLDVTGTSAGISLSAKPEVKLSALVEISHNLSKTLSLDEILPKTLDSLFKIFVQADRGFVIMRPNAEAPLVAVADKHRKPGQDQRMRISRTIVEEAMTGRKAILSADAATDERFEMAESISDFQIRSMMCAPMVDADGNALGVIQVDTLNHLSRFEDDDLEVLAAVASQAAVAIDNARMHEFAVSQRALQRDLDLAARMQRALLPAHAPEVPGYHFFDFYESARQVGGDYYDYILLADGRFAVVVGDVAGKGVSAALLMARLSSDVRFCLASEQDPALAVTRANNAFAQRDWADRFVTMIVAVVDPTNHRLTLVNAGHMPPLLRRANGEVEAVSDEQAGLPLGVLDDYEYESCELDLGPGDSLTVFTDGFSEAMNASHELYGLERLERQVRLAAVGVEELGQHVLEDVRQFVGSHPQSDDMCLACFGRSE